MTTVQNLDSDKPHRTILKKLPGFVTLGFILATIGGNVIAADNNINAPTQTGNNKFIPYYPKGCSIAAHTCLCVQDLSKYRDVWYTQVNNDQMSWEDADGWATGLNINAPNPKGTCGIKTGWGLPNSIQMKYFLNNTVLSLQTEGFVGIKGEGQNYWAATCHLQQCRGKDWIVHSYTYVPSYKFAYLYSFISSGKYKLQTKEPTTNVGGAIAVVATSGNN